MTQPLSSADLPKPNRRAKLRIAALVIAVLLIIVAIVFGFRTNSANQQGTKVASAVKASFPNFCQNGIIQVEPASGLYLPSGNLWGIYCDIWLKGNSAFYGYATIVDANKCTTIHPTVGTTGQYYTDFEALNKSNGQRMAVCP